MNRGKLIYHTARGRAIQELIDGHKGEFDQLLEKQRALLDAQERGDEPT